MSRGLLRALLFLLRWLVAGIFLEMTDGTALQPTPSGRLRLHCLSLKLETCGWNPLKLCHCLRPN